MISLSFPINSFYIATLFYVASLTFFFLSREGLAKSFLGLGLIFHTISEISGRFFMWPYCNMFAEPFFLPWCFSAISFILILSKKEKEGLSIIPLVVIFSIAAILFSEGYYSSFSLKSKSIFSHIFHLFNFIAHACFLSGAYLAIFTILKNKKENISHHMVIWGFAFYCMAGASGMLWNYMGWSDTISWNHYYFHSVAIWFYYSGFLHLHLLRKWDLKKGAWVILGGALLVLYFDYLPQIGGIHLPGVFDVNLY